MRYLYFFCFGLFLLSCKKGDLEFVLKGNLTDQTFGQNLSGATVELYQVPVGTTSEKYLCKVTVASDGNYSFTFLREKMEKYILKIEKTGYFSQENIVYF